MPLGTYTSKAALSGFQNSVRRGNRVEADKTTEVPVLLSRAATSETITVMGQQPVVDRTNVTANTHPSKQEFEKAPLGRRLLGVDLGAKFEIFNVTDRQGQLIVNNTTWSNMQTTAGTTARDAFGKTTARGSFQSPRAFRVTYLVRF